LSAAVVEMIDGETYYEKAPRFSLFHSVL